MKKKAFLSSETGPWWQNQISLLSVSRWQQIVTDGNIKNGGGLHLGVSWKMKANFNLHLSVLIPILLYEQENRIS